MNQRAAALLAAFLCAVTVLAGASARAAELYVSPSDFGVDPTVPLPLPPPPDIYAAPVQQPAAEPTGNFLTLSPPATVPFASPLPVAPVVTGPFVTTVPGGVPLQTAAPDLYASLTATVTATTGDPSIPVVVRPATTAQATDAAGIPVNLAGIAAQGSPVVDWNAARAGTPYPVEDPSRPGVMTYVVPIQVPVYVQPGQAGAQGGQTAPAAAQLPSAALPGRPYVETGRNVDPFANIVAITPGANPVVPAATAAIAGNSGVYYYGQNPVSIASALGLDTATGTEFLDFNAMPSGAINLVTPAQIQHALLRGTPLVILDVRSDFVRDIEGHVVGDVSVPLQPEDTFAARVARAIPEKALPVVVYCHDGVWSSRAADALLAMGYRTFLMGSYRLWL